MLSLVCESEGRKRSHRREGRREGPCGSLERRCTALVWPYLVLISGFVRIAFSSARTKSMLSLVCESEGRKRSHRQGEDERGRVDPWNGVARDLSLLAILGPHIRVRADGVLLSENEIDVVSRMRERGAKTFSWVRTRGRGGAAWVPEAALTAEGAVFWPYLVLISGFVRMGFSSARTKSMLSLVCESEGRKRSRRRERDGEGVAWIPETALDSRGLRRPAILCRLVWGCTDHVLARENEKRCLLS